MTQLEIATFIERMEELGDEWTEEEVKDSYGTFSLQDALSDRMASVNIYLKTLGTAAEYLARKRD